LGQDAGGQPLRVGVIGATDRVRERFRALFEGTGRGACLLVDLPAAEALVVDIDQEGAWAECEAHRLRAPKTPVILIGADPRRCPPGYPYLAKPIVPKRLLSELAALREALAMAGDEGPARGDMLQPTTEAQPPAFDSSGSSGSAIPRPPGCESTVTLAPRGGADPLTDRVGSAPLGADTADAAEYCGHADDVDLGDPARVARFFLSVDDRLLGACRAAVSRTNASGSPWCVRVAGGVIRPEAAGGPVHCNLAAHTLRDLCDAQGADQFVVEPAAPPAERGERQGPARQPWDSTEAFLWQVALWTYRGRLPSGTAVHGRVYLTRWPNLTRLAEIPHALRIAALWLAQPVSLAFTVDMLGIPQRYVFAFYGAAHAAGLAGQARRAADHLFESELGMRAESRHLLAGVAARLRGLVGR